ncbi:hypothetical protein [Cellulomonas endophytica]|uniref:hypothetical protein n=1 Tax=Cellulomonas endophytica TaxID=2494735 RepID=UPI00101028D1|nr:hypothetical protein [Cellulomonas endophytica]
MTALTSPSVRASPATAVAARPARAVGAPPSRRDLRRTTLVLLALYVAARVWSTTLLAIGHRLVERGALPTTGVDGGPGLVGFLTSWDGQYYAQIAAEGYPRELPRDGDGEVAKNAWAFMPVFPLLLRGLAAVTGLGVDVLGVAVALVAGAGATVALHRLVLERGDERAAFGAAVLLAWGPMSFLLGVAYAESLFLLLLLLALRALLRGRLGLVALLGVVAAFTRPGALALPAAVALLHLLRLRRGERPPAREHRAVVATVLVVGVAGAAWPLVVTAVTGVPEAYFATETAWWKEYTGEAGFVPFTPWFRMAGAFLGPVPGPLVVAALLAVLAVALVRRAREQDRETSVWTAAYLAYLVAVFLPQQSTLRLLLPLAPLLGEPWLHRTRRRCRLVLAGCVLLQPALVLGLWVVVPP